MDTILDSRGQVLNDKQKQNPLPSGNLFPSGHRLTIIKINKENIMCYMVVSFMVKKYKLRKGVPVNVGVLSFVKD